MDLFDVLNFGLFEALHFGFVWCIEFWVCLTHYILGLFDVLNFAPKTAFSVLFPQLKLYLSECSFCW
jgi:hypothetical protein